MDNHARIKTIRSRLSTALNPLELEVIDESHLHLGHAGAKDGRGHFALRIKADCLAGESRINAHRKIYAALGELMQTDIHALRIELID